MSYPVLYDVYDNGKLILKSKSAREISKVIGTACDKIRNAANDGRVFKKRYYFKESMQQLEINNYTSMGFIEKFGEDIYKQWICLNQRYGSQKQNEVAN